MWLGDQITNKGIGNGISLLIFAGIVSRLPRFIPTLIGLVVKEGNVNTVTDSFDFKVTAPEASTITDAAAEAQQGNPGLLIAIIIIVILVIVIIVGAVKRAREKKFE